MRYICPFLLILLLAVSVPQAITQSRFFRNVVEEFALRAKREAQLGERVPVPEAIFQQAGSSAANSAASCTETHRHALLAYRIPGVANEMAFAVLGRGFCYCDPEEGNCRLWVFTYRKEKFEKVLETDEAQSFGFVRSKSNLPLLVIWTRLAPDKFGGRVFRFYAGKYDESGAWVERYKYADEDSYSDEPYYHEIPLIESRFAPGQVVPD